ncbi:MAG: hypothetical protein JWR25_1710, partial [Noviherbaspirillum sp.]|nr:hypothetical protein [Noviherbaspirillum sp.]
SYLQSTLKNGFWPRYYLEDMAWHGQPGFDFLASPMVCFCDIPLSRIGDHIEFYGSYGIGMRREWAAVNHINPVVYIAAGNNHFARSLGGMGIYLSQITDEMVNRKAKRLVQHVMAHIKPIQGRMPLKGKDEVVVKDFYQESEWRHVATHKKIAVFLPEKAYRSQEILDAEHATTFEHGLLKFTPTDVNYIFVESDADIPQMMAFIQKEMTHCSYEDRMLLMSRVTSLELIRQDV